MPDSFLSGLLKSHQRLQQLWSREEALPMVCCHRNNTSGRLDAHKNHRLPKTVVPSRYQLNLMPGLNGFAFSGEVRIQVTVVEPVSEIVLNAKELAFQEAIVSCDRTGTTLDGTVTLNEKDERATIRFAGKLSKGAWTLSIKFTGQ